MTIYVVFYRATEDLSAVFAEYGTVKQCITTDRETGRMRGFAFVEMKKKPRRCGNQLDGAEWMGRQLRVIKQSARGNSRRSGSFSSGEY